MLDLKFRYLLSQENNLKTATKLTFETILGTYHTSGSFAILQFFSPATLITFHRAFYFLHQQAGGMLSVAQMPNVQILIAWPTSRASNFHEPFLLVRTPRPRQSST